MMDEWKDKKEDRKLDAWMDDDQIDICKQTVSTLTDILSKCTSFILLEFKRKKNLKKI